MKIFLTIIFLAVCVALAVIVLTAFCLYGEFVSL